MEANINFDTITYREFNELKKKNFNEIPLFFFFNEEQFDELKQKLNIKKNEELKEKVIKYCGGIILKSEAYKITKYNKWVEDCEKKLFKRDDFLKQVYKYELSNHEYILDPDFEYWKDMTGFKIETEREKQIFIEAEKEYMEEMREYW